MKKFVKKLLCVMLVVCVILPGVVFDVEVATATASTTDDKYNVSYDSSKYTIKWAARRKVYSYNQYGSMWSDLDKGDKLGSASIDIYYLEPKESREGEYYAIAGCRVLMNPVKVSGDVKGMSMLTHIGIETINDDSRECSPTLDTYDNEKVILIQNRDDNKYAIWDYDYEFKDGDVKWNEYLFSTSVVTAQVEYRLDDKPTDENFYDCIPKAIEYEIIFGAGDTKTGKVAKHFGFDSNWELSECVGKLDLKVAY